MLVVFQNPALLLSIILLIIPSLLASSSPGNDSHVLSNFNPAEYEGEYDTSPSPTAKPVHPEAKRCNYDLCKDQQPSCQELAAATGCSCPGMTGPHEPPDAPHLRRLSQGGSGSVLVHWCAPASTVTYYLIQVKGDQTERRASEGSRQMNLGEIEAGTEVCVLAGNKMGVSNKAKQSCTVFQPQSSESGLALRLGIIGGVVALIVVLVLVLLLWRFRTRRKTLVRTAGAEAVL